ncbi:hypothetical protein V6N12_023274 [Hibiscus sabdariffa]|uniref:Uncharacterized protein n=1 Tax=Hibiscus sabdariffa TaxID=183260 RepID=A0ABR2FXE0_9ROSI
MPKVYRWFGCGFCQNYCCENNFSSLCGGKLDSRTKANLLNKLETNARPGTKEFMEALVVDVQVSMIGQLGAYFYLLWLVIEKVIVTTKHNVDEQYVRESQVIWSFSVTRDTSEG